MFIKAYRSKLLRKIIGELYSDIIKPWGHSSLYIMEKWESELGVVISRDEWETIIDTQLTTTYSQMWRYFSWKNTQIFIIMIIIHRLPQNKSIDSLDLNVGMVTAPLTTHTFFLVLLCTGFVLGRCSLHSKGELRLWCCIIYMFIFILVIWIIIWLKLISFKNLCGCNWKGYHWALAC